MAAASSPMRVLVVGGGMTAAAVVRGMRRRHAGVAAVVWEQSAALGGRMRTTRDATPCDVGAQYYTPTVHGAAHVALLQEWQRAGLVRPFSDIGTTHTDHLAQDHYVALHGMTSLVAHALRDAEVVTGRTVAEVQPRSGGGVTVTSASGDVIECEGVVVTCPAPQAASIKCGARMTAKPDAPAGAGGSDVDTHSAPIDVRAVLAGVKYSTRYAVTLLYSGSTAPRIREALCHAVVYTPQDDVVRFVAVDTARRQGSPLRADWAPAGGGEVAVLVHSSVQFAAAVEAEVAAGAAETATGDVGGPRADAQATIVARVRALFPTLPDPSGATLHVLCPSQVSTGAKVNQEALALESVPIVFAGDYFTSSNIDGCCSSGDAAAELILARLGLGVAPKPIEEAGTATGSSAGDRGSSDHAAGANGAGAGCGAGASAGAVPASALTTAGPAATGVAPPAPASL